MKRNRIPKDFSISTDDLEKAFNQVRGELHDMDVLFDGSPLDKVECYNDYLDIVSGTYAMGFCHRDGNIHIPHLYWAALRGYERPIVDVIRHEFGHAMAQWYPDYFSGKLNKTFKAAFGRTYDEQPAKKNVKDWEKNYVSKYAGGQSREDWAETFEQYMIHGGKIPEYWKHSPAIVKKWNAVSTIVKIIAKECKKNARKSRRENASMRKKEDFICPECGDGLISTNRNGDFECPECGETFSVTYFPAKNPVKPVQQPDYDTCGWATAKWLLESFGCDLPTDNQLESELNVRKGDWIGEIKWMKLLFKKAGFSCGDINGTLPYALWRTLQRHGLKFVSPGLLGSTIDFFEIGDYMDKVFEQEGRFACGYKGNGYYHWVGIERIAGKIRVMDPTPARYIPWGKHEASKLPNIFLGFVKE